MNYKIIGFSVFKSKKGSLCRVLQLTREYNQRESEAGSFGVKCEEVFLPDDFSYLADPSYLGKEVRLYYNRNGYLDSIDIMK